MDLAAAELRSLELTIVPRTGTGMRRRASMWALPTNPAPITAATCFMVRHSPFGKNAFRATLHFTTGVRVPLILPLDEGLPDLGEFPALVLVGLRELEVEGAQLVDDDRGHGQAGEPLVVGRYDVPGRVLGRGVPDHLLVGLLVVPPAAALLHVGHGE